MRQLVDRSLVKVGIFKEHVAQVNEVDTHSRFSFEFFTMNGLATHLWNLISLTMLALTNSFTSCPMEMAFSPPTYIRFGAIGLIQWSILSSWKIISLLIPGMLLGFWANIFMNYRNRLLSATTCLLWSVIPIRNIFLGPLIWISFKSSTGVGRLLYSLESSFV